MCLLFVYLFTFLVVRVFFCSFCCHKKIKINNTNKQSTTSKSEHIMLHNLNWIKKDNDADEMMKPTRKTKQIEISHIERIFDDCWCFLLQYGLNPANKNNTKWNSVVALSIYTYMFSYIKLILIIAIWTTSVETIKIKSWKNIKSRQIKKWVQKRWEQNFKKPSKDLNLIWNGAS